MDFHLFLFVASQLVKPETRAQPSSRLSRHRKLLFHAIQLSRRAGWMKCFCAGRFDTTNKRRRRRKIYIFMNRSFVILPVSVSLNIVIKRDNWIGFLEIHLRETLGPGWNAPRKASIKSQLDETSLELSLQCRLRFPLQKATPHSSRRRTKDFQ